MECRLSAACLCNMGRVRGNNEDNFYFDGRTMPLDHTSLDKPHKQDDSTRPYPAISQFDGKGGEETYTSNKKGVSVPVAIIVNENSASASEILAAAVLDYEAGVVDVMTTFGKGAVQNTKRISSNGAWLKMTVSAYYTPGGESINGTGVTPDIEVDLSEEMKGTPIDQLDQEQDSQLWAALDYVRELAGEQ